jgi:hypothetical protein
LGVTQQITTTLLKSVGLATVPVGARVLSSPNNSSSMMTIMMMIVMMIK